MDIIFIVAGYLIFFAFPALFVYRLYTRGRIWTILHYINWFAIVILMEEVLLLSLGVIATLINGDSSVTSILVFASMMTLIIPIAGLVFINLLVCLVLIIRSLLNEHVKADIFVAMIGFGSRPKGEVQDATYDDE